MAVNEAKYRQLVNSGYSHHAALLLADPTKDTIDGGAVADMGALTAPADIAAVYTEAEVQALRNDLASARTKINELLAALRTAGVIS